MYIYGCIHVEDLNCLPQPHFVGEDASKVELVHHPEPVQANDLKNKIKGGGGVCENQSTVTLHPRPSFQANNLKHTKKEV